MMIEIFSEFLIEMKMKMNVRENFSLLMTREIIVSLMFDEMLFLLLIDLEVMILEIQMTLEVIVEMMFFVIQILMKLVTNNHENFVQNQFLLDE
jgi:hypothetical protein